MRVLVLAWRDVRHPEAGGSETYVHEVAARLVRAGHAVVLVTSRPPGLPAREVLDGIVHVRRGGRLGVYPWALSRVAGRLGAGADVVLDVNNGLPFFSPLVRRRPVVALVHHLHRAQWAMIFPGWRGRVGWFVESRLAPRVYRDRPVVTVSDASKEDLVGIGMPVGHVTVAPCGLTPPPPGVRPAGLSPDPLVCVVGRLVPHKQVEHAIAAVAAMAPRWPGLRLEVVGDGAWRGELEALARALGVSERVRFLGHVGDTERDEVMARAWVHLMPSAKEGWGLVVSEAGLVGTPTIGYRCSGGLWSSVVDGVTGWLVEDERELRATLERVLGDEPGLRAAGRAAAAHARGLDWDTTATRITEVLRVAVGTVSGRRR